MSTPRSRPSPTRKGMTLIEAMVAIAIFAIVATMVFGGFSQTMRNKRRVEEQSDRAHVIRVAMERMVREMQSAFVSLHVNPNAQLASMRTAFHGRREGRGSRLDFTSFSHRRLYRDAHESDQNELAYFMTRHPEEPSQQVLARREQRRIDDDPEHGGQTAILIEDVEEFELSYYDNQAQQWVDSWDASQGATTNRLPYQVRIQIVVPSLLRPDHDETYTTRTWIPINWALNHALYNP